MLWFPELDALLQIGALEIEVELGKSPPSTTVHVQAVFSLGNTLDQVQHLTLSLPQLQEVPMGLPLKPVMVLLEKGTSRISHALRRLNWGQSIWHVITIFCCIRDKMHISIFNLKSRACSRQMSHICATCFTPQFSWKLCKVGGRCWLAFPPPYVHWQEKLNKIPSGSVSVFNREKFDQSIMYLQRK